MCPCWIKVFFFSFKNLTGPKFRENEKWLERNFVFFVFCVSSVSAPNAQAFQSILHRRQVWMNTHGLCTLPSGAFFSSAQITLLYAQTQKSWCMWTMCTDCADGEYCDCLQARAQHGQRKYTLGFSKQHCYPDVGIVLGFLQKTCSSLLRFQWSWVNWRR